MTGRERLEQIHHRLLPLRTALLGHSLYGEIHGLEKLRVFMQQHVFAVWDFMSLLKSLQQKLCHADVPWLPPADPLAARFIHEIVLGEESDEDGQGGYASHFELYHRAMQRAGAGTQTIDRFLAEIKAGASLAPALKQAAVPQTVQSFVLQTFEVIANGELCEIAAAFTFGREDLLPGVFQRIIETLNGETQGRLDDFRFYLNRHIELDEGHHGPMAARLISSLCGEDAGKWRIAEAAAVAALEARIGLWDGMHEAMRQLETADSGSSV